MKRASWPPQPPRGVQRGVSVANALSGCQSVFRRNPDQLSFASKKRLFELSQSVNGVDSFISHSWKSDGRIKRIALILHEVGVVPMIAALVACLATGYLHRAGDIWPGVARRSLSELFPVRQCQCIDICAHALESLRVLEIQTQFVASPWEYLAGLAAAAAAGFLLLASRRRRVYFVDAVCIHQTDSARKVQGIRCLAGFVAASQRLLVLWDEHYFTRLWCVYELAVSQSVHPNRPVTFLPLRRAAHYLVALAGLAAFCSLYLLLFILWVGSVDGSAHAGQESVSAPVFFTFVATLYLLFVLLYAGVVLAGADMALQLTLLRRQLERFDVRLADCYNLADRQEIYAAIESRYDGGLEAFNQTVRTALGSKLMKSARPYSMLLTALLPSLCFLFGFVPTFVQDVSAHTQIIILISATTLTFATLPCKAAWAMDRGGRLVGVDQEAAHLRSFASRARLAVTCTALRSATESSLITGAMFVMFALAEWPERFGLGRMPSHAPVVWVSVCLWNATWIAIAYRTFRARGVGSPQNQSDHPSV